MWRDTTWLEFCVTTCGMVPESLGFRGYERSDVLRESEAARRRRPGQRRACVRPAGTRADETVKTQDPTTPRGRGDRPGDTGTHIPKPVLKRQTQAGKQGLLP